MKREKDSNSVDVSVVVAARNEEEDIRGCISRMPHSPNIELVVVDDASTDGTPEILSKLPVTVYRNDEARGAASSWDRGAREAKGEFIQLVGADSWVEDSQPFLHYFRDPKVVQVVPRIVLEGDNLMSRIQRIHDRLAVYTHDLFFRTRIGEQSQNVTVFSRDSSDVNVVPWSHALMRKRFYLEVNPPVDLGVGEEHRFEKIASKLIMERDYKLVYDPDFIYHWGMYATFVRRLKQQRYYGRSVWFNLKRPVHALKLFPLLMPAALSTLPFSVLAAAFLSAPLVFRFLLGLKILKRDECVIYPVFVAVTLVEHLVFSAGFMENLLYRVFKGGFMTYK